MWEIGKMDMRRYNLAVLKISETHWTQAGQKRLATGEMLLYSGHVKENAPHTQGVALMLSKEARNALVGRESHGSTIIKASFKTKKEGILMNIIQCYAPTNDSNDDIKDHWKLVFSLPQKAVADDILPLDVEACATLVVFICIFRVYGIEGLDHLRSSNRLISSELSTVFRAFPDNPIKHQGKEEGEE
ncbi:unnamed protein product [Schistosoma margrebowiei]|uniref:Uncharacterized protein n=1 Tax=Schistosoma margrebowiei TaxID=48269 RepID=A0A183MRL2_9TREM|nr:unnamed protein product [Schistosoma margrebowiei]